MKKCEDLRMHTYFDALVHCPFIFVEVFCGSHTTA